MPTSDSVPNDGDNVVIEPDTPLDNTELTQLIASLSEQIDDLTSGDLDSAKLKAPTFGCWPDSRYNTVVTFDSWSRIACLRLPK